MQCAAWVQGNSESASAAKWCGDMGAAPGAGDQGRWARERGRAEYCLLRMGAARGGLAQARHRTALTHARFHSFNTAPTTTAVQLSPRQRTPRVPTLRARSHRSKCARSRLACTDRATTFLHHSRRLYVICSDREPWSSAFTGATAARQRWGRSARLARDTLPP